MRLVLIGFRGTGKSTVARQLALALACDWIDADVEIELRAGKSIKAIFETEGEARFRALETEVLRDLLTRPALVVAAGGGAVTQPENRRMLKREKHVFWLTADVDTILDRLARDPTTLERRPQLTNKASRAEIEHLLRVREPCYQECATCTVDTVGRSPAQIAAEIVEALNLLPPSKP